MGIPRGLAYRDLNSPHTRTHTLTHTTGSNYIGGVSDLSLAQTQTPPLPPDSTRLDPTRLQPPWRGHGNHLPHLTSPASEIAIRYHRSPPSAALQRRRLCLGRQRYSTTHRPPCPPYYLPLQTTTPCSIPVPSHHSAPYCTAPHPYRSAHQRIAWCHRLVHHRAPGLHDSSPAVNTPAAACRPTQLRPHRAAVSTCCAGPRRKCSTIGQSIPHPSASLLALPPGDPAAHQPHTLHSMVVVVPGSKSASLQSVPRWSCPPSGGVHPAVMAGLPPAPMPPNRTPPAPNITTLHHLCAHAPCPLRPIASF